MLTTETAQVDLNLLRFPLTIIYLGLMLLITGYGLHRWWLIGLYAATRRRAPRAETRFDELPAVTVQLPMFNERVVAQRIIDAACSLDYPADRLQVQVLDDSTDEESARIARQRVRHWRQRGVDVVYLHRADRVGFKAGALADAMPAATGQFIAVFDADFVPRPDFLQRAIHHFTDGGVGMVQARWSHLNRRQSTLTRCEAAFIDGHFAIEQSARQRSGRWFHFNGTAGVWRRETIEEAGGWSADTLCEDLDLSIRAQLAGWRFVYLNDLTCPAELPPTVAAFKQQQHRWFKGTTQVMFKLLGRVWRSPAPLRVKSEVFMQLTGPFLPLCLTLMALMYLPANAVLEAAWTTGWWAALPLIGGLAAATAFYVASQFVIGRSVVGMLLTMPAMVAVGMAIALTTTRGVIEALVGHRSAFLRTPKFNGRADRGDDDPPTAPAPRGGFFTGLARWMPMVELAFGGYMLVCVAVAAQSPRTYGCIPLLVLFMLGYLWFAWCGLNRAPSRFAEPKPAPARKPVVNAAA